MSEWWNEWQLRILVLASLSAQYLILLFLVVRGRYIHIPPGIRSVSFPLAHIGSDALAIFGLATLFNRQKNGPGCRYMHGGSRDLELLWAPILVMHLGGQVHITSYKIEDNEQWRRHILTALSKVTVTLYVFYKSWSSDDKNLLAATVLLFVLMVCRCLEKAFALKSSSFNALREASSFTALPFASTTPSNEQPLNIDDFIKLASALYRTSADRLSQDWFESDISSILQSHLFFDVPYLYSQRVEIIRKFCRFDKELAYQVIEKELYAMTSILYTKDIFYLKGASTRALSIGSVLICYPAIIIAMFLVEPSSHIRIFFEASQDIKVTVVLLYGTFVLEVLFAVTSVSGGIKKSSCGILQHNLIGALAHNKWGFIFRRMAGWSTEPSHRSIEITELILEHVESAWKDDIRCSVSYKKFNDTRGDRTLAINGCVGELSWSIRRPFGESVILWHLATDLCFHHKAVARDDDDKFANQCKTMSDYMMHLLSENPEMLMPGTKKKLFKRAYKQLEENLKSEKTQMDEREIAQKVIEKCKAGTITGPFIQDAWKLAESLMGYSGDHGDETKMWNVIQGVWVEMMCFSASRCRGYLHAEALGTGMEYLSFVWFILAYSGMETFSEKLQRDDPPVQHGREYAAPATTTNVPEIESGTHVAIQVEAQGDSV